MAKFFKSVLMAALAVPFVHAQTYTTCNPLTATCPANPGMKAGSLDTTFKGVSSIPAGWSLVNTGGVTYDSNGINLVVAKQGDNPTIQTNDYFFFGSFSVTMRAAGGQGIVSSLILLSDDLDEIDWEFTGTNTAQVQTNFFGKGVTGNFDQFTWESVSTPQSTYHTYKVDWTPEYMKWIIDGNVIRTVTAAAAGNNFPQSPMRVKLGIWAGGDPNNGQGTIEWAGGLTNFANVPFSMSISDAQVVNYSPADSYTFSDNTGSYQSIKISGGTLMSNANGAAQDSPAASSSSASPSASSASTNSPDARNSSSGGAPPTGNPIAAVATTTAVNTLSNTTLSSVSSPTGSTTSSGAGASSSPGSTSTNQNAAALLVMDTASGSFLMAVLALGASLFL